jgi:hypothetical protein
VADTVLAVVPRSDLSVVLTAFHRGGYGHVVRVIDPERSPLAAQLPRAGVTDTRLEAVGPDQVVLFVPAPQRATQAAALAMANGAVDVDLVTRGAATSERVAPGLIARAEARRDRRASRRTTIMPQPPGAADAVAD